MFLPFKVLWHVFLGTGALGYYYYFRWCYSNIAQPKVSVGLAFSFATKCRYIDIVNIPYMYPYMDSLGNGADVWVLTEDTARWLP